MSTELSGECQGFIAPLQAKAEWHKQALADKKRDIANFERAMAAFNEWRPSKYDPDRIAQHSSGVVRVKDAGDLIADAGLSKAKKSRPASL